MYAKMFIIENSMPRLHLTLPGQLTRRRKTKKSVRSFRNLKFLSVVVVSILLFVIFCVGNAISKLRFSSECFRIAHWLEIGLNVSTSTYVPLFQLSNALVFKIADKEYSKRFLPDYFSCRIIIERDCHGLMDCAFIKLKILEAIHNSGTLTRMPVVISDYDAIVLGRILHDTQIYSALPGHKTWSTSLMGFGKNSDIGPALQIVKEVYSKTLRDDVAFRAVRGKKKNSDIQPTFHARGKAWPTKDPILAYIISIVFRISTIFWTLRATNTERVLLKTTYVLLLSLVTSQVIHSTIKLSSVETGIVPDDSDHVWISLPLTGISSMLSRELIIVRYDLYGPYLTGFSALLAAVISVAEEFGIISLMVYYSTRITTLIKIIKRMSIRKLRSKPHIFNTLSFLIINGLVFILLSGVFGLSEPGGIWTMTRHCNKVKCISLDTPDRFLKFTWDFALVPVVRWSLLILISSISVSNKKSRRIIIVGMVVVIFSRIHLVSSRAFPGKSIPSVQRVLQTKTKNGSFVSFDVGIPSIIGKVETSKINVGQGRLVRQRDQNCKVHPNWNKVIWMKSICQEIIKPRSIIFFDDDVKLNYHQDYHKLGLDQNTDATLVEDPHSAGRVVSFVGRFNLDNCSLISTWLLEMPCGVFRTLNDQPALNYILKMKNFTTRIVRIPVLHRDRGSAGFGLKPTLRKWQLTLASIILLLLGNSNRFDATEELIFHTIMTYMGGQQLKEVPLQGTSASPYTAVREIMDKKRVVEWRPQTYIIFEDYTGRAVELNLSFLTFLKSTLTLICITNLARFLISLISGIFIISGIDVLTALASKTGHVLQGNMAWHCLGIYSVVPVEGMRAYKLSAGECPINNVRVKRKLFAIAE